VRPTACMPATASCSTTRARAVAKLLSPAKSRAACVPEITAQEMCAEMVANDLAEAKKHALLKHHGYSVNVSVE